MKRLLLIVLIVSLLVFICIGYTGGQEILIPPSAATPWFVGNYPCVACKMINDTAVKEEDLDNRPFSVTSEIGDTFVGSSGTTYVLVSPTSQPPIGSNAEYVSEWVIVTP